MSNVSHLRAHLQKMYVSVCFPYTTEHLARLPTTSTVMATVKKLKQQRIDTQKRHRVKKKTRVKPIDEDVVLPDVVRMMETEETVEQVTSISGIKLSDFWRAQETDEEYGSVMLYLRDGVLPTDSEKARYNVTLSVIFGVYGGLLFLN